MARAWAALRTFMAERSGVVLTEDQGYLMEARLAPVAKVLRFDTVDEYVLRACAPGASNEMIVPLIDAMTTHETYFFRDTTFWRGLKEQLLGRLTSRPLKVWCAACSTGQEVYSLAMLLDEVDPMLLGNTEIHATDISEAVVARGRSGQYSVFEANRGLSAPRLLKYFEPDGSNFRVKERLRKPVTWSIGNLLAGEVPHHNFDLVLARNVLIYFSEQSRQAVLSTLRNAAHPRGFLGVGTTEILGGCQALLPGWYAAR